ncbi:MAG: hypothetical protein ACXV2J_07030, partial [Actinomycetes bacterium]
MGHAGGGGEVVGRGQQVGQTFVLFPQAWLREATSSLRGDSGGAYSTSLRPAVSSDRPFRDSA